MIVTDGEKRSVAVFNTSDQKITADFVAGPTRVRAVQWAGPNHVIVTTSSTTLVEGLEGWKREYWVPMDADIQTRRMRPVLSGVDETMNVVYGTPMIRTVNGKSAVYLEGVSFVENQGHNSLFRFGVDNGVTSLIRQGREGTDAWLVDADGKPLAESIFNDDAKKWTLRVAAGGDWHVAKSMQSAIEHPTIEGLGRDGHSILIADGEEEKDGSTMQILRELAPGKADWDDPFARDQEHDAIFDQSTGALIGVHTLLGDVEHYQFFDPILQKYWDAVVRAYPGDRVTLATNGYASISDDRKKFLVSVDSPVEGPSFALVDIAKGTSDWLGGPYDDVLKDLAAKTAISFKAADGLALSGYLTTPKGAPVEKLPLVVFPHGGPASRDEPGFDWWAQAMASRGYAVLQVNYRGSDGFGWDFQSAGFGQFGRKMQTDLSDGVRYLASQGKIDPKRVCIVGASYGGYAALAGATLDAPVYRCAVSVAGISDLHRMVRGDEIEDGSSARRYWLRYLGATSLDDPKVAGISPINHIDRVAIPILLIHGADDTRVPFEQSQLMFDALQRAGKPVELVKLNHEDHHLLVGDTRLQMLQATIDFLQKNNPP